MILQYLFLFLGSVSCTCIGKNRAFQYSDGSCLCRTGFIYYNELDFKSSTSDSELDCQPEASKITYIVYAKYLIKLTEYSIDQNTCIKAKICV